MSRRQTVLVGAATAFGKAVTDHHPPAEEHRKAATEHFRAPATNMRTAVNRRLATLAAGR